MDLPVLSVFIRFALVLATTFLFAIVFLAYLRSRNRKLLFISAGFGVFFIHALITIPELFVPASIDGNMHLLIHLIGLVLILAGTLKD